MRAKGREGIFPCRRYGGNSKPFGRSSFGPQRLSLGAFRLFVAVGVFTRAIEARRVGFSAVMGTSVMVRCAAENGWSSGYGQIVPGVIMSPSGCWTGWCRTLHSLPRPIVGKNHRINGNVVL
jgi:hypothetical protein